MSNRTKQIASSLKLKVQPNNADTLGLWCNKAVGCLC